MRSQTVFGLLCVLAAATIVGCGGGSGTANVAPAGLPGSGSQGVAATGSATFTLTIPARSSASTAGRAPAFVSPNAASIGVAIATGAASPGPATIANLSASSPNCAAAAGGALTCTITVSAPAGSDTFVVTLYSGQNGTGSVLSSATVTGTVTAAAANSIPITLNGTVASIAVSVTNGNNLIPGGYATTLPVVVTAKDAAGATIVGPGTYTNPIKLANADTSGVSTLSTTTVAGPATAVTLTYAPTDANSGVLNVNGLPIGATQISASADGVPASATTAGTFQYIADRFAGFGHTRLLSGTGTVTTTTFNTHATPSPNPSTWSYAITDALTVHGRATFNGVAVVDSNHVVTYTQTSPVTAASPEVTTVDDYHANTLTPTGAIFYLYGETTAGVNSGGATSPITGNVAGTVSITNTYPIPGAWQADILPHTAATWADNNLAFNEVFGNAEVATFRFNADGSTSFNETSPSTLTLTQTAAGGGTNVNGTVTTTISPPVAATPPSSGNVIPVTQQTTSPTPGPVSTLSAADWYPGGGAPPAPLWTWAFMESSVAIPGTCNVPAAVATTAFAIVEQQDAVRVPNFQHRVRTKTDYFVPGGIGLVCETFAETDSNYRFDSGVISSQTSISYAYGVVNASALDLRRMH